ncbi:MAG: cupin domain-containing protein [Verrucomicrobia bacterium]|nr:cupin domain-containing protein [Verrucomicrobiota bacterium]
MLIPPLINFEDVPEIENFWGEKQKYKRLRRHVSKALGSGEENNPVHPFDVEMTRVLPRHHNCAQHCHPHMAEFFIIVSGEGIMYRGDEEFSIKAGDCFYQPAGVYHRMFNTSETEYLVFYVIANEVDDPHTEILRF